jgi:trehalose/maltose hydrolase-like predicted phosphorylase
MAARVGQPELGLSYFRQTAAIDLRDSFANGGGGLHMAALAGLWQAAVFGFAGLGFEEDALTFRPCLPVEWQRLTFRLQWRGRQLEAEVTHFSLVLRVLTGKPLAVHYRGRLLKAAVTRPAEFPLVEGANEIAAAALFIAEATRFVGERD